MGKNKLKKFADMDSFGCALQYPREVLLKDGFLIRGNGIRIFSRKMVPSHLSLDAARGNILLRLPKRILKVIISELI